MKPYKYFIIFLVAQKNNCYNCLECIFSYSNEKYTLFARDENKVQAPYKDLICLGHNNYR